jgi:hypothetical protein
MILFYFLTVILAIQFHVCIIFDISIKILHSNNYLRLPQVMFIVTFTITHLHLEVTYIVLKLSKIFAYLYYKQ